MRVLSAVSSMLLGMYTLQQAAAEDAPQCDDQVASSFFLQFDDECEVILDGFKTCSDNCLASMKDSIPIAPNCTYSEKGKPTLRQSAETRLKTCEAVRGNSTSRYIPQLTPGVRTCDADEVTAWRKEYGNGTEYFTCYSNAMAEISCSDECVKILEAGVQAAPACGLSSGDSLTMFESEKKGIASCVLVRGESVSSNTVLQSTASKSSNTISSEETLRPRWTPPPPKTRKDSSTTTPSSSIAPSEPAASSSPRMVTSFAAAVLSCATTLVVVV